MVCAWFHPGAQGRTVIPLVVHDKGKDSDPSVVERLRSLGPEVPLYLTGNAALVAVLSEALAQDFSRRHPTATLDAARTRSSTLVKLVHAFTREALTNPGHLHVPRVAVFDEGQRAWDHKRMTKEHQSLGTRGQSEPEVILQGLESKDWGVVVVLVGVGQEINNGEPGAELWVQAAQSRPAAGGKSWHVAGPPDFVSEDHSGATMTSSLHLRETRRSLGALWLAEWVEDVLADRPADARERIRASDFPLVLTRSLDEARSWLRHHGQHRRFGLVASARAGRLRPYGIEMDAGLQGGINWPRWFLDRPPSLQSSTLLEIAASEFKCQGLEIDLVGLCWSWDMVREEGQWHPRRLDANRLRWNRVSGDRRRFSLNAYRVLLTRARQGMVLWIPAGSPEDPTRDPAEMDAVASYLLSCGVTSLPSSGVEPAPVALQRDL